MLVYIGLTDVNKLMKKLETGKSCRRERERGCCLTLRLLLRKKTGSLVRESRKSDALRERKSGGILRVQIFQPVQNRNAYLLNGVGI